MRRLEAKAGDTAVRWAGDDASGRAVPPGLYLATLDGGAIHAVTRVIVVRMMSQNVPEDKPEHLSRHDHGGRARRLARPRSGVRLVRVANATTRLTETTMRSARTTPCRKESAVARCSRSRSRAPSPSSALRPSVPRRRPAGARGCRSTSRRRGGGAGDTRGRGIDGERDVPRRDDPRFLGREPDRHGRRDVPEDRRPRARSSGHRRRAASLDRARAARDRDHRDRRDPRRGRAAASDAELRVPPVAGAGARDDRPVPDPRAVRDRPGDLRVAGSVPDRVGRRLAARHGVRLDSDLDDRGVSVLVAGGDRHLPGDADVALAFRPLRRARDSQSDHPRSRAAVRADDAQLERDRGGDADQPPRLSGRSTCSSTTRCTRRRSSR